MILHPLGKFKAAIANKHAEEPELTNTPNFFPKRFAIASSNSTDLGPCPPNHPERSDSSTSLISSSP
jgi:hypothetical protein